MPPRAPRLALVALSLGLVAASAVVQPLATGQDLLSRARAALSQTEGELRLPGLLSPVEVIRDSWGVPHIYAGNTHDLFVAQGFVAAQDRLWQLDLWRRIAQGELAEILGPAGVTRDTFARLLRYRGDLDVELASYGRDSRAIIEAFVQGVNAQVDLALSAPDRLPIEFQLTGTRPERWTAETVIGRMAGFIMTRNARTELQRARLIRELGAARAAEALPTDPPVPLVVPDGLDLSAISDEVLALAAGSGETVDFSPLARAAAPAFASGLFARGARPDSALSPPGSAETADDAAALVGSNNWVISGARSATGRPLLANDPHRTLMVPSLRYTVHLVAPGWNVIGAGEPALPGVAVGHNDRIAFGFTIAGMDQQDLYVERLDPGNHDRYLHRGQWLPVTSHGERIEVRGEGAREIVLRFTRHGPVVFVDEARHLAWALRWVGAEPGSAGYLRSLALNRARSWADFLSALDGWKVPSENLVYADVDGNIGWAAAGLAPIRKGWNGLLPVPGHEGKYEWNGFVRVTDLPRLFNPKSGMIATANHNVLPPGYRREIGYEFSAPYRFARTLEVLGAADRAGTEPRRFTVPDFERLQHDETSAFAVVVRDALRSAVARMPAPGAPSTRAGSGGLAPLADDERRAAAGMLLNWDAVLGRESAPAALYQLWLPRLARAMASTLPERPAGIAGNGRLSNDQLLRLFEDCGLARLTPLADQWVDGTIRPDRVKWRRPMPSRCGPAVEKAAIAALTGESLRDAWEAARQQLGPDPSRWAWGRHHTAEFTHPLAFDADRAALLGFGPVPRGGDATTPNSTGASARQTHGASFRAVFDLSDWDQSTTTNVPGLSGQPGSPHYGDLLPLWAEGRYHPLAFSRGAVDRVSSARLTLRPPS